MQTKVTSGIPDVEQRPQDAADEHDLQQRRQDVEQHEAEEEVDALGAALDRPADGAGAPVEMEAQAQRVQVLGRCCSPAERIARCATLANTASRSSPNAWESMRATP